VEDKFLEFSVHGAGKFSIFADTVEFRVGQNGLLSELTAYSPKLTVEETYLQMNPIVKAFGGAEAELAAFLEKVKKGLKHFGGADDEVENYDLSTRRPEAESGETWMGVSLVWTGGFQDRPIRIRVGLTWARPIQLLRSPAAPIQAPAGYEQLSMEPGPYVDEWIRKGEIPPPNVARQLGPEGVQRVREQYAASKGVPQVSNQPPPSPNVLARSDEWLKWLLVGVASLILLAWACSRWKKST
jgi:hypothetical protein